MSNFHIVHPTGLLYRFMHNMPIFEQNMLIKLLIGIKPISVQLMSRLIWIYSVCPLVIDFFQINALPEMFGLSETPSKCSN